MKRFIVAVAMILVVVCPLLADETKEATKEDEKAILAVMKDFEEGIAEKDAKRLAKIFIYPGTPLLGANSGIYSGKFHNERNTAAGFVKVVTGPAKMNERLFDFEIFIDKGIATVNCKYEFFVNDKMTNYGNDIFSLIKTSDGWKVMSVVYTSTPAKK